ncbi:MAG TPA: ABC transporter permease [Caldilineaceae bacterium]|nr:ABC transporter permease [Caldilineaceae bacterium]
MDVVRPTAGDLLRSQEWLAPLVVFVAVIALWEATVALLRVPVFLLPAPHQILASFIDNAATLFLYGFNTFREAAGGFAIGCGLGVLAAMVTARYRLLADVLVPVAVASNSIPIVAMAPLAIVWFGIDEGSKIAIVAVMCFFPTLVSTVRGLTAVSPDALDLMRSYAASEWETFTKLRLPTALPYLFNAFKICSTLSMIGAIVAEFFGGSVKFLGVYIKTEANILHTTNAWAAIIVACLIGIGFYLAIAGVERLLMPWHVSYRREER